MNFLYVILSNILKVSGTILKSLVLSYIVLFIIFIIEYLTLFLGGYIKVHWMAALGLKRILATLISITLNFWSMLPPGLKIQLLLWKKYIKNIKICNIWTNFALYDF
jgi:hypothetical protein